MMSSCTLFKVSPGAYLESVCLPHKSGIEADLIAYVDNLSSPKPLIDAIQYALFGKAKRLRPAFVRLITEALGNPGAADEASLAVEFFHTASLIADDMPCMDNDTMRRGRPTVHVAYGEATALLASYAFISAGYEQIARNGMKFGEKGFEIALIALENVAHNTGVLGATGGQWLDLFVPHPNPEELKEILYKKTVSLFEIAFVLGWLFGQGDLKKLPEVKSCAAHFGVAFQIADDLHDALQDNAHVYGANYALTLGQETAKRECLKEIEAFSKELSRLEVPLTPLKRIAEELAIAIGCA